MRALVRVIPSVVILALTLVAALPWGIGSDYRFLLPNLVFAIIHYFTLRHEAQVPEIVVFISGLTLDVLTGGPLGYWSLVFLSGYAIARTQAPSSDGGRRTRWALTFVAMLLVGFIEWSLASVYYLELADWRPIAIGAIGIGLAYPALAFVLHTLDAPNSRRDVAARG